MPEKEWKDLYLCKSMNDLKDKAAIERLDDKYGKKETKFLMDSLKSLLKKIVESEQNKDMESMYIYLSRFMELFVYVQRFKKDDYLAKYFSSDVKNCLNKMDTITVELEIRYMKQNEAILKKDGGDISLKQPTHLAKFIDNETDDIEEKRLKKSEKETVQVARRAITCGELRNYTNAKKTILILDLRSPEMFQITKINLDGVKSINIPNETVPSKIGKCLENQIETKELWQKRKAFDVVVIVDDGSSDGGTATEKLLESLSKYDYPGEYKCLKYLEGGFREWQHKFPTLCTNASSFDYLKLGDLPSNSSIYSLDSIKYPSFSEEPPASVHKTIKASTHAQSNLNDDVTPSTNKQVPAINRQTKPTVGKPVPKPAESVNQNGHDGSHIEVEASSNKIADKENTEPENGSILKTTRSSSIVVDRTNKPSTLKSTQNVVDKENQIPKPISSSSNNDWNRSSLGTTFEPLKSDSSSSTSSIKRSSSSPNLSKLTSDDDDDAGQAQDQRSVAATLATPPKYDRATKPVQQPLRTYGHPHGLATDKSRPATDAHDTGIVVSNNSPGLTGLKNLGNTCYMNSIVQCLSNTDQLRKEICRFQNDSGAKPLGSVAHEVDRVVRRLWAGTHKNFPCDKLKNVVGKLKTSFRGCEQQDSHEFLTILLDWLHEDLNEPDTGLELMGANEETGEREWGEFRRKNNSIVQSLFYGQLKSTVTCRHCGKQSVTFEPFSNLSLLLPNQASDCCTLQECLELYVREESITGWNCPNCKTARAATKKIDISKLPPTLVIHLKRFTSNGARKKQTFVDFPVKGLDMARYTTPNSEQRHHNFHLYAVSNHYGTMESGHYTAYCLNAPLNKWFKFDDTEVNEMQVHNVRTAAAYILFYSAI